MSRRSSDYNNRDYNRDKERWTPRDRGRTRGGSNRDRSRERNIERWQYSAQQSHNSTRNNNYNSYNNSNYSYPSSNNNYNNYNNNNNYRYNNYNNYNNTNYSHYHYRNNQQQHYSYYNQHSSNPSYSNQNINKQSQRLNKFDRKYTKCPGPLPHTINKKNLNDLSNFEFWVTEKSDGIRMICYLTKNNIYFINRSFDIYKLNNTAAADGISMFKDIVLLDGELIYNQKTKTHSKQILIYKIFDCMAFNGVSISKQNSSIRYKYCNQFIKIYNEYLIKYYNQINDNDIDNKSNNDNDNTQSIKDKLSEICSQLNNDDNNTLNMKNKIINLIRYSSDQSVDIIQKEEKQSNSNSHDHQNILNDVDYELLPILFLNKKHYKATKEDLTLLTQGINLNTYLYTDPVTKFVNKNDGLVFQAENNNYLMNRYNINGNKLKIRKWKPPYLRTIDCKIKKCINYNNNSNNVDDYVNNNGKLILWVFDFPTKQTIVFKSIDMGINNQNLNQMQQNQRNKLSAILKQAGHVNELIVECDYDFIHKNWCLLKWRDDKKYSNSLKTVQATENDIIENIQITDLINACPTRIMYGK